MTRKLIVLQNIKREGPGLFLNIAEERGFCPKIYHLYQSTRLPEPKSQDLILILGGSMGLNDMKSNKYKWLYKEVEFIKKVLNK